MLFCLVVYSELWENRDLYFFFFSSIVILHLSVIVQLKSTIEFLKTNLFYW